MRKVLLKFSSLTFFAGKSPPLLNQLMEGVGLGKGKIRTKRTGRYLIVTDKSENILLTLKDFVLLGTEYAVQLKFELLKFHITINFLV